MVMLPVLLVTSPSRGGYTGFAVVAAGAPPAGVFVTTQTHSSFFELHVQASPRISLVSTSKLAGVPASSVFSPLTIDS
jgi:hypothetical protein